MATLAALLKSKGYDVRGSDQNVYPPMSDFLRDQGITLLQGYKPEHIQAELDLVVVGNAISRGNPELEEVLDRKIRYCSMPEAVRDHFLWGARSVVIAGTHGKTTTTSLTGWLLAHGGADPSVFIGGIAENFESSFRLGGGREFVIDALAGRFSEPVLALLRARSAHEAAVAAGRLACLGATSGADILTGMRLACRAAA